MAFAVASVCAAASPALVHGRRASTSVDRLRIKFVARQPRQFRGTSAEMEPFDVGVDSSPPERRAAQDQTRPATRCRSDSFPWLSPCTYAGPPLALAPHVHGARADRNEAR
eukprot:tig00021073_g18032.t1